MKTILVDAVNTFVIPGEGINEDVYKLLESYPNRKLVLTNADDSQIKSFQLDKLPYELFTLKHDPEKTDPNYFRILLDYLSLNSSDVVYFEHNLDAVKSARILGITSFHYNKLTKDLKTLKEFLKNNLE